MPQWLWTTLKTDRCVQITPKSMLYHFLIVVFQLSIQTGSCMMMENGLYIHTQTHPYTEGGGCYSRWFIGSYTVLPKQPMIFLCLETDWHAFGTAIGSSLGFSACRTEPPLFCSILFYHDCCFCLTAMIFKPSCSSPIFFFSLSLCPSSFTELPI